MSTYNFLAALPGIASNESIPSRDFALLCPSDEAYSAVVAGTPGLAQYLGAFTTPLGVQLQPPIVVTRLSSPVSASDLVAFRDCIAFGGILKARMDTARHDRLDGFTHSDSFDLHAVNLGRDSRWVTIRSPSEHGLHELSAFRGQPPWVSTNPTFHRLEIEPVVTRALLGLFDQRSQRTAVASRVFRCLHAAMMAARAPFQHLGSEFDYGMTTGLWIPAFEILAHPGGPGDVSPRHVEAIIKTVPWPTHVHGRPSGLRRATRANFSLRAMKHAHHGPPAGQGKPKVQASVTPPVQVYQRLYAVRCAFLHGDPSFDLVGASGGDQKRGSLLVQAPALLRFVLLQVLKEAGLHEWSPPAQWREGMGAEARQRYRDRLGCELAEQSVAAHLVGRRGIRLLG